MYLTKELKPLSMLLCVLMLFHICINQSEAQIVNWSDSFGNTNIDSEIMIQNGQTIRLDQCTTTVGVVRVMGALIVDEESANNCPQINFTTRSIRVMGSGSKLQVGETNQPYTGKITITLTGALIPGESIENRALMVMRGGELRLHGLSREKVSWAQIKQTATTGSTELKMATRVNWDVGDEVVIASSSMDPTEAERITVTGLADNGMTVNFEPPLVHDHYGQMHHYQGKKLDMRSAVGLLSRNIVIQGDQGSADNQIGGHIMVMNVSATRPEMTPELRTYYESIGRPLSLPRPSYQPEEKSVATVEGVELRRMGQMGRPGRYSFHWHLVDNGVGQYFNNNSVHTGYQRAVNVHGTDGVLVHQNVAYDVFNHMYAWAEEGDEIENVFTENLGVLNKQPPLDRLAFSDPDDPPRIRHSNQEEGRPGVFWGQNSYNTIAGNRAAGSLRGMGFFYDIKGNGSHIEYAMRRNGVEPVVESYENIEHIDLDLATIPEGCQFYNNVAHSIYTPAIGTMSRRGLLYPSNSHGWGVFTEDIGSNNSHNKPYRKPPFKCTIDGLTTYKNEEGGAWIENGTVLKNAIISDSNVGALVFDSDVINSVVVGQSPNRTGGQRPLELLNYDGQPVGQLDVDFSQPMYFRGGWVQHPAEKDFHLNSPDYTGQPRYGITPHIDGLTCIGLPNCVTQRRGKKFTPQAVTLRNVMCRETQDCLGMLPNLDSSDLQLGSLVDEDGSIGFTGEEITWSDERFDVNDKETFFLRVFGKAGRGFPWPTHTATPDPIGTDLIFTDGFEN